MFKDEGYEKRPFWSSCDVRGRRVGKDTFLIIMWCSRSRSIIRVGRRVKRYLSDHHVKGRKRYLSDHRVLLEVEGYEKIPFWSSCDVRGRRYEKIPFWSSCGVRGRRVGKYTFLTIMWFSRSNGRKRYLPDHRVMLKVEGYEKLPFWSSCDARGRRVRNDTFLIIMWCSRTKGYLSDHHVMFEVEDTSRSVYERVRKIPFWSSCDVRGRRVGKDTFLIIMWCSRSKGWIRYLSDHRVMLKVEGYGKLPFWSSCDARGRRVRKDTFLIIMWCSRSKAKKIPFWSSCGVRVRRVGK